jgi:hypothetical protein
VASIRWFKPCTLTGFAPCHAAMECRRCIHTDSRGVASCLKLWNPAMSWGKWPGISCNGTTASWLVRPAAHIPLRRR